MDEQVLEDFLLNKIEKDDFVKRVLAKPHYKEGNFSLTRDHLLKLCDLRIENKIDDGQLENISDFLIGSDYFNWDAETKDGEIVEEKLNNWGSPSINFPINDLNLGLWREYIKTGDNRLREFNLWSSHIDGQ